ncbi:hypothetical protein, partial [Desulfosarcina sp.]|uniref:hypothetical protein n=1 Tax=Desulfosarcina sp. TaxID=2027861 RepID=UPI0035637D08
KSKGGENSNLSPRLYSAVFLKAIALGFKKLGCGSTCSTVTHGKQYVAGSCFDCNLRTIGVFRWLRQGSSNHVYPHFQSWMFQVMSVT